MSDKYACSISNDINDVLSLIDELTTQSNAPFVQDEINCLYSELSAVSQNVIGSVFSFQAIISHIDQMIASKFFGLDQTNLLKEIKSKTLHLYETINDES